MQKVRPIAPSQPGAGRSRSPITLQPQPSSASLAASSSSPPSVSCAPPAPCAPLESAPLAVVVVAELIVELWALPPPSPPPVPRVALQLATSSASPMQRPGFCESPDDAGFTTTTTSRSPSPTSMRSAPAVIVVGHGIVADAREVHDEATAHRREALDVVVVVESKLQTIARRIRSVQDHADFAGAHRPRRRIGGITRRAARHGEGQAEQGPGRAASVPWPGAATAAGLSLAKWLHRNAQRRIHRKAHRSWMVPEPLLPSGATSSSWHCAWASSS